MKPIPKISLVILLLAILSVGTVAVFYDPLPDEPYIIPYPSTEPHDVTITVVVDTPLLPENQINGDVRLYIKESNPYRPVYGGTRGIIHELTGNTCTFVMPYYQYANCTLGGVRVAGHEMEIFFLPALDENQCDAEIHVSLTPTPESEQ